MPDTPDDNTSVTVGVIRGLVADVAELKRLFEDDRAAARAQIESAIVQLRQDFHRALGPLQIDNMDHRRAHEADRAERVARQTATDLATARTRSALLFIGGMIALLLVMGVIGAALLVAWT